MKRSSKLLVAGLALSVVGLGISDVKATDIDIDATMTASVAVSATKDSDLDFGALDFSAGHIGLLELGPNGVAAFNAAPPVTNLTASGIPTAGQITITSAGGNIDVTCDTGGVIDDGTRQVNIQGVKWDVSAATYTAAARTCGGLGVGAVTLDTTASPNPVIYVGAQLNITNDLLLGSGGSTPYDTSTGVGDPVTFRIVYQ